MKLVRKVRESTYPAKEGRQTAAIQACLSRQPITFDELHALVVRKMGPGARPTLSQTRRHVNTLKHRGDVKIEDSN